MPPYPEPVSQAQRRWAFANRGKKTAEGKAASEFAKGDPGGKLPERVKEGKAVKKRGPGSRGWYDGK